MRIDILTIFPDLVENFASASLLGKARTNGLLDIRIHDLRSVATDPHRSVDDSPFGGGAGMVLKPEPIFEIVERQQPPRPLIYLSPSGPPLTQAKAVELAELVAVDRVVQQVGEVGPQVHLVINDVGAPFRTMGFVLMLVAARQADTP